MDEVSEQPVVTFTSQIAVLPAFLPLLLSGERAARDRSRERNICS